MRSAWTSHRSIAPRYGSSTAKQPDGWGKQAGVLPERVFIHFYGHQWIEEMHNLEFVDRLDERVWP